MSGPSLQQTDIDAELLEAPPAGEPLPPVASLARSAAVVGLGSGLSRFLGVLRETVKAELFGATAHMSAFEVAATVPSQLYDLLIGGMVSSALVPVFSEYIARDDYDELWRLASALLTFAVVSLLGLLAVLELGAALITSMLASGLSPDAFQETMDLLRLVLPAIFFLALSGVLSGLLYALKRFTLPAFVPVVFNLTIIASAVLLGHRLSVSSLALGWILGSVMQVVLQLPALRGTRLRPNFHWNHPGLRHIVKLYFPVIAGLVITQVSIVIGINLATHTGDSSVAWMRYATFLFQFPLGLVSSAISVAILPTLSRQAAQEAVAVPGAAEQFRGTLAQGLRLVLLLVVPATAGLLVLGRPLIALLYEHGNFTPYDTEMTTYILAYFLAGLIFAAVDQPLVFAFYARKDTLTPALVGVAGVAIYLAAAWLPSLWRPLQITDLALANAVQLTAHALIMIALVERRLRRQAGRGLAGQALWWTTAQAGGASVVMALVAYLVLLGTQALMAGSVLMKLPVPVHRALLLVPPGAAAVAVYAGLLWNVAELRAVRVRAANMLGRLARRPAAG